ncbi:uncharacterized protein N7483_011073 [Penicillium malachiteum]|uniref:uncharacterized protein n=1 Tax=Penicillium malachiteum TaxID=1324776 RepID=UPI0025498E70|nr:uncharacterized protein N7483_011073 [Penicillium malachiteum]KAJ5713892.1 hypothetical protein N7483_011073 [Penicillium malachiteum]
MAYTKFHHPQPDFEKPIFCDIDGSSLYEAPYGSLLTSIIQRNDVTALYSYNNSPNSRLFLQSYDSERQDPFSVALGCRSFDVLRALISIYISDPSMTEPLQTYTNRCGLSLIHRTCSAGEQDMVEWLINHEPPLGSLHDRDPTGMGWTPLLYAAEALGIAGDLILDADVEEAPAIARKKAILGQAIPYASYGMVSRLITKESDVHTPQTWSSQNTGIELGQNVTPLHIASLFWNLDGIQALIDHRGDVGLEFMASKADDDGRLPLHWAFTCIRDNREEKDNLDEIISRMTSTMRILLDAKPDTINTRDHHGSTVFHYAARLNLMGHEVLSRAIQKLLDALPSLDTLNVRNHRGATAVGDMLQPFTSPAGTLEQIMGPILTLLANGADAHLCDNKGRNVLHRLCMSTWKQPLTAGILGRLLEFVDINDTDVDGRTALDYLVSKPNRIDAAHYLRTRAADATGSY